MTTTELLTSAWAWPPSVVAGCAALLVAYGLAVGFRFSGQTLCFVAGVLTLLLALVSPLDTLADTYLFSAHMLQHLLLLLVTPPLLLLGLPSEPRRVPFMTRRRVLRAVPAGHGSRLLAWTLGIGTMWLWHLPVLYNLTLANEGIHVLQHLCFLTTATLFWWPILTPWTEERLAPLPTILYLFAAVVASSVLGIILTFAPPGLYPAYLQPPDTLGILPLVRQGWGLSPAADQQLGGLLMWVGGSSVYFLGILAALAHWYSLPDDSLSSAGRPLPMEES